MWEGRTDFTEERRGNTVPSELRALASENDHKGARQRAVYRQGDAEEDCIQVTLHDPSQSVELRLGLHNAGLRSHIPWKSYFARRHYS